MNPPEFNHPQYLIRRNFFSLLGQHFRVYGPQNELVLYAHMKAFRLKEDIRLYRDEACTQEVLVIKARQVIDFESAYDVFDAATQQRLGALRRKGLRSMFRDKWELLNYDDQVTCVIEEDNWWMALLRRFLFSLVPQKYQAAMNDRVIWRFHRCISFFIMKMTVQILPEAATVSDPRMALAAGILLCAIEGNQSR